MLTNYELLDYLNQLLSPDNFQDYAPNGLQIEGGKEISKIITGVSISENLIDEAVKNKANAIIVHHGLFWQKDEYPIIGLKRNRIAKLIENNINLYAYHLPLDNHPELGNNIQLAKLLDFKVLGQADPQNLVWYGELAKPITIHELNNIISSKLNHKSTFFSEDTNKLIKSVAWCTGGADSFFNKAINLGVDAYITGEVSEPIMYLAHESNVAFIAAGHYATERGGIMALTEYLKVNFKVEAKFIELYNPI